MAEKKFTSTIASIENRLQNKILFPDAQFQMLPKGNHTIIHPQKNSKESSVLILLYPFDDEVFSFLILRPQYKGVHSGQISLPGGKKEVTDKDTAETALRETEEESGINRSKIHLLGLLSEIFIPHSNFKVFPYVGYLDASPHFMPDPLEVEEIIPYDINVLRNPSSAKHSVFRSSKNKSIYAPYFEVNQKYKVWGATAMILSEFKEIISCEY